MNYCHTCYTTVLLTVFSKRDAAVIVSLLLTVGFLALDLGLTVLVSNAAVLALFTCTDG